MRIQLQQWWTGPEILSSKGSSPTRVEGSSEDPGLGCVRLALREATERPEPQRGAKAPEGERPDFQLQKAKISTQLG